MLILVDELRITSIAAANDAAVFPIPVGAAHRWKPCNFRDSLDSRIMSICPGLGC